MLYQHLRVAARIAPVKDRHNSQLPSKAADENVAEAGAAKHAMRGTARIVLRSIHLNYYSLGAPLHKEVYPACWLLLGT